MIKTIIAISFDKENNLNKMFLVIFQVMKRKLVTKLSIESELFLSLSILL